MGTVERLGQCFKSKVVAGAKFSNIFELPLIKSHHALPKKAIPFEKSYRNLDGNNWVHFYTYDYHFERVWRAPERYLPLFKRFKGVISPDFSIYRELPLAMQIWNTYRGRALTYWLQSHGIAVIPNVRWSDERSFQFAFEGLPYRSTVAISTNGCLQKRQDRKFFKLGLAYLLNIINPKTLVVYGNIPPDIFTEQIIKRIRLVTIPHICQTICKKGGK